jgi:DNA processing protein
MPYEAITISDKHYPLLLKEISGAPEKLFVRGVLDPQAPKVAIVGTRKPSRYGIEAAQFFSRELALRGFTIISGLAFGIDKAAHESCVSAGGKTIAVLASGVDRITPTSHEGLARRILATGGAIVSEFLPGEDARPETFPQRNRIISGLAIGVVIIEAPQKSGALITARFAAEQNREVFVVPGPIFSPNFAGSHGLIREGAILVNSPEDVLSELKQNVGLNLDFKEALPILDEAEQKLLKLITSRGEIAADELAKQARMGAAEFSAALTLLEMKRYIRKENEKIYPANF